MITTKQFEYCCNNIVATVAIKLNSNNNINNFINFLSSDTYKKLMDKRTYLWTESADYIIELFNEEMNR